MDGTSMTIQIADIKTEVAIGCACGQPATLIALRHLIGACTGPFAETPDGAEIQPVCTDCARLLHQSVARDIEARLNWAPDGTQLACHTCSRPILAMHNVIEWMMA
jgi:hypothetical protein